MGLTYDGKISIGGLCPTVVAAFADVFAELQAKLAGVLELAAQLKITPPTTALSLQLAEQLVAGLTLAVGLPGVDIQITAVAALLEQIQANLLLLTALEALFGVEVFVYDWQGPANAFGPALGSELAMTLPDGSPSFLPINALILLTPTPEVWVGVKAFFGGF